MKGIPIFGRNIVIAIKTSNNIGRTILFVSHDLNAVERFCDRVVLLENGEIKEQGESDVVIAEYQRNMKTAQTV